MTIAVDQQVRSIEEQRGLSSLPALAASFYLGLGLSLHLAVPIAWRWPLTLVVAALLSLVGWRRIVATRAVKTYIGWVLVLSAWVVVSSVAAWAPVSLYRGRMFIIWVLVIVPGLSSFLRDRVRRDAFVAGFVSGASVFGLVAVYRLARGVSVFDLGPTYPDKFGSYNDRFWEARSYMLGQSRNIAAVIVLMALPFLVSKLLPRPLRIVRWPLVAANATWIVFSGSRIALLGSVVVVLVAVLMQPGGGGKLRRLYAAILMATIVFVGIQEIGGQARTAFDRLTQWGSEGPSTEVRELTLRKAWHLTWENPFFGVGMGRFARYDHPVLDEATNRANRESALFSESHNGFAGLMAEAGVPALALFLILIAGLLRGAISQRGSPAVRAATCVLAAALVGLVARPIVDLTFAAMVLALTTVSAEEIDHGASSDVSTSVGLR